MTKTQLLEAILKHRSYIFIPEEDAELPELLNWSELARAALAADEPVALQMECFECESKDHWTKDCPRRTAVKSSVGSK